MHIFWDPAATRVLAAQKQIGLVSTEAWEHYHSKHSLTCGFYRSADFAASVQDLSQKLGSNAFQKQMV